MLNQAAFDPDQICVPTTENLVLQLSSHFEGN